MIIDFKNVFFIFGLIILLIFVLLLIVLLILLLSNINYNLFFYKSKDNYYCKFNLNYLFNNIQFDGILHEKLFIKYKIFFTKKQYNSYNNNDDVDIDNNNSENDISNSVDQTENFDEYYNNKLKDIDFNDDTINLKDDFIREEKEYIDNFTNKKYKNVKPKTPKSIFNKISLENIKEKYFNIKKNITQFKNEYFSNQSFNSYNKIKNILIKVLNIIKPNTFYSDIKIGIDDAYYMAKVLMYLSFIYALYKDINITPIYNQNVLEGYIKINGKFNLFKITYYALVLYFSKDTKKYVRKLLKGKKDGREEK